MTSPTSNQPLTLATAADRERMTDRARAALATLEAVELPADADLQLTVNHDPDDTPEAGVFRCGPAFMRYVLEQGEDGYEVYRNEYGDPRSIGFKTGGLAVIYYV